MTCAVKVVNRIVANARRMLSCARSLRTRLLCHRANCPEPRVRHSHGDRGRPLCPASQRRIGRPAAKVLDRAVKSQSSKALLRQRGMHLERSFEHVLDEGGMRRATLQGKENLTKQHKIAAACFNLGVGTPNTWMAGPIACLRLCIACLCERARPFRTLCAAAQDFVLYFPKLIRISTAA
jgi:hypothetical protein